MADKKWQPGKIRHEDLVKKGMADPVFKAEYDKLEEEFAVLDEILAARKAAGLTQEQIADRMGTRQSSIARLENGLACGNLPSMTMLKKYAAAVGKKLQIRFV